MVRELLDPRFLLRLHETFSWVLLGIVILGIAAEGVCILFLCLGDRQPRYNLGGRPPADMSNR